MKKIRNAPVKENETITKMFRALTVIFLSVFPAAAFMIELETRSSHFVNYIIFAVSVFLVTKAFAIRDKRCKSISFIAGVIFSAFMTFGNYDVNCKSVVRFFICFIGFFVFFQSAVAVLLSSVQNISLVKDGKRENTRKVFWMSIAVLLLAWLPYFLAYFPVFTTEDSISQLEQVTGTKPWNNWHPILHTLIIKATYSLGLLISGGNQTIGVAVYSIVQTAFMALVFAYFLVTLYRFGINKKAIIVSLGFFALYPVIPMYNITMWKDVWFAGVVLAFLVTLWRLLRYWDEHRSKKLPLFEGILFFVLSVCVCLLRSNGYYAFILTIPFLFFAFRKKTLKVALIAVLAFAVAFIIKGPVYNACNVERADILETIGVPMQHICGAITDGAELSAEEEAFVNEILPIEKIKEVYTPSSVDWIKMAIREEGNLSYLEAHKKELFSLWFHLGLRNPVSYFKAQVLQTFGFWYPDVQFWIYPWFTNDGFTYQQTPLLPQGLSALLNVAQNLYLKVPIISAVWSLGLYTWVLIISFFVSVFKKRKTDWVLYILPLAIIASLMLATPVYAEFRYAYSIVISMPLFVIFPFGKKEVDNNG